MDRSNTDGWRREFSTRDSLIRFVAIAVTVASMCVIPAHAADTTAPSVPGNLVVVPASSTQLNLSWNPSTDNVAVTAYLVERCSGAGCTSFSQIASVTGTTYSNTALTVSTSYSYRVRARDAANNKSGYSTTITASTPPDTQAPTAPTGMAIAIISDTQLNLSWVAATDDVKVTGYLVERCLGAGCTSFAQVATPTGVTYNNTGLVPATSYRYRVRAKDAANNVSAYSSIASAATPADTQAPTIPTGITLTVASSTKITVTWTASTDDVQVAGYRVERCQGVGCTAFTQVAAPTGTSFANTGLVAGSSYRYRVNATDATGNLSAYSVVTTALTTGADATAPTVPTSLIATPSSTQINLTWIASTDNVAVSGYRVERCQGASCTTFAQIGTATTTSYNDSALSAATSYRYRLRAIDAANNVSAYSTISSATTPALLDTQAPTVPSGVTANAASPTQMNILWTASIDNTGVTGYLVERCQGVGCSSFTQIACPASNSYVDASLTAATSYRYRLRATDAANNISGYSITITASTPSPPPVTYSYHYDSLGRLTQSLGTDGSQIDYQYDDSGNVTTISRQ